MDIVLDVGELYFGLNSTLTLEKELNSLVSSLSSVSVSNELPSAGTYSSLIGTLKGIITDDIDDLIIRLENSKRILQENDAEAALLFKFFDQGIIDGNFEFTDMPLLDQTDYDYIKYSQGTVATSGCGLTSLCMVASYFTGQLYTPDDLAAVANAVRTSNVDRMTAAADYLGLKWHLSPSTDTNDLKQYLSEGKVVICLVKNSSHFVVCKGITEDGQILVNDPYGPWAKDEPYSLSDLKMSCGNTWVFDPAENQHVRTEFSGDVVIEANVVEMLQNENGFVERVSEPLAITLSTDEIQNLTQSQQGTTVTLSNTADNNVNLNTETGNPSNVNTVSGSNSGSTPIVNNTSTSTGSSINNVSTGSNTNSSSTPIVNNTSTSTGSSSTNASTGSSTNSSSSTPIVNNTSTSTGSNSTNASTGSSTNSSSSTPIVNNTSTSTGSSSTNASTGSSTNSSSTPIVNNTSNSIGSNNNESTGSSTSSSSTPIVNDTSTSTGSSSTNASTGSSTNSSSTPIVNDTSTSTGSNSNNASTGSSTNSSSTPIVNDTSTSTGSNSNNASTGNSTNSSSTPIVNNTSNSIGSNNNVSTGSSTSSSSTPIVNNTSTSTGSSSTNVGIGSGYASTTTPTKENISNQIEEIDKINSGFDSNVEIDSNNISSNSSLNYSNEISSDILSNGSISTNKSNSSVIMSEDNEVNSKNDYSKYIVPGLAGVAVAGAATYGIVKNKKEKDSKDNNENLDNSEEESYII